MRTDYRHVIINCAGRKSDTYRNARYGEELPFQERMAERLMWRESPSDRLSPLLKCLRSHIGQSFASVHSKLCSQADPRNIRGYHLRTHLRDLVVAKSGDCVDFSYRFAPFLVDEAGILRKNPDSWFWRRRYNRKDPKRSKTKHELNAERRAIKAERERKAEEALRVMRMRKLEEKLYGPR